MQQQKIMKTIQNGGKENEVMWMHSVTVQAAVIGSKLTRTSLANGVLLKLFIRSTKIFCSCLYYVPHHNKILYS